MNVGTLSKCQQFLPVLESDWSEMPQVILDDFVDFWQRRHEQLIAIIDVRERWEHNAGHIPSSSPLPIGTLEYTLELAVPAKHALVLFYDNGDDRSAKACDVAASMGFTNCALLSGGFPEWRSRELRIDTGWGVDGKRVGEEVAAAILDIHVSPDQLEQWQVTNTCVVLDIRPEWEHQQGHVPGAFSAPSHHLVDLLPAIRAEMRRSNASRIVTHCSGRTRGITAAEFLRGFGLQAHALENGSMGWRLSGREISLEPRYLPSPRLESEPGRPSHNAQHVFAHEVAALAEGDRYIIDVRSPASYFSAHPATAISLPAGQVLLEAERWLTLLPLPVFVIGSNTAVAVWAADLLGRMGYITAVVHGGYEAWRAQNLPLQHGYEPCALDSLVRQARCKKITPKKARKKLSDFLIVDVRSQAEWAIESVPEAVSVPRRSALVASDQRPLLLVSTRGNRAALVGEELAAQEPQRTVRILEGGLERWKNLGYETVETPDAHLPGAADSVARVTASQWLTNRGSRRSPRNR